MADAEERSGTVSGTRSLPAPFACRGMAPRRGAVATGRTGCNWSPTPVPAPEPRADIALQGEQVTLRDVEAILPSRSFVALAPTGSPWTRGDLDQREHSRVGAAINRAKRASSGVGRNQYPGSPAPLDLGAVTLVLNGAGDRLSGPVSNTGGDLAIGVTSRWPHPAAFRSRSS